MGATAFCWAMWLCRNDIIFNNMLIPSFLQVLFRGTYLARFWSMRLQEEGRHMLKTTCSCMESTAMEIFANNGWRFSNRLTF